MGLEASTRACEITVNGVLHEFSGAPHTNALDFLRACGTLSCKEGCAEGECGACAVMVARPDGERTRWVALNSCLLPAAALDGQEVISAEGLGTTENLHPVQQQMITRGGSQCGYCTPGFICAMAAEYYRPERKPEPAATTEHQGPNGFDLQALSGNLCRCTGYRPIRDAAFALGVPLPEDRLLGRLDSPAPPPVLSHYVRADHPSGELGSYFRPASLAEALGFLAAHPESQVVAGCTDWGVQVNLSGARSRTLVAIDRLPELRRIEQSAEFVQLGAACTLSEVERYLAGQVPLLDALWPQFASRLIRNAATLGGNLGTGSPIGDAAPVLLALDAQLVLASAAGERMVALAEYFTGYRKSVRADDELIASIRIPLPLAPKVSFQKISKRRFDDISSVSVALAFEVNDGVISRARIGVGGIAATPLRAVATEQALLGQPWNVSTLREAGAFLAGEGTPLDDHRASAAYRRAMLAGALERFAVEQREELS